ncbi:polysaccharide deacetylase family protein [Mycobacterium sp. ITM-2016-00318]|uniref:polysaccharide deacetylase family protein n=1 Tax=Mycobacterium sp. ITM-2016-00318 TaxID=2099693 RepID=UPI001304EB6D|nr:polysaccharide deacetylase family protein [Mycobacterium sp. ITM-2016-00318]WNG92961.1 polysaccharide deacetylase family protein [Mycobacterium sp. ITM-2016-00318]
MYRLSTLLAVTLLASGCGVTLVKPTEPVAAVEESASAAPRVNPFLPSPVVEPLMLAPGQTVVTLTFDDGRVSNARAAQILNAQGLRGTFYVNSGGIGQPGFLALADLDWIATSSGNEIAGHTATHAKLDELDVEAVRREVCNDRTQLMRWGFPVRNFAYPFGYVTPELEQVVAGCGYNSARGLGELATVHPPTNPGTAYTCADCDWGEAVPPVNSMDTRAPAQVMADWSLADYQRQVTEAQAGGGWVQFTFHGMCPIDCSDITASAATFTDFVIWLADQQAQGGVIVRTVGEVIGGPVQPAPPIEGTS